MNKCMVLLVSLSKPNLKQEILLRLWDHQHSREYLTMKFKLLISGKTVVFQELVYMAVFVCCRSIYFLFSAALIFVNL